MLAAFTAGLLLITISELGDKTFFIAVILSMRHPRNLVFAGVIAALAAMTVLSVALGHVIAFLPKIYTHYTEIALFLLFGIKLLYQASQMSVAAGDEVLEEAKAAVEQSEKNLKNSSNTLAILLESFIMTFLAEWGDRTQIATITLAASNNALGVTAGAVLGHTICTVIAVMGGKLIAGRISERMITAIGGVLFLVFAAVAFWEGTGQTI
ncbi:TMEM165/GDT1 family protein [Aetokthonos hydrillicola Thurmond2011]|uniref:GDT1 family protein n=1 Tax=Aetokthonos hydrillicola Thurmond2011 TaxID=2712845 RepID=A0AAP5MBV1_9CYAN|nr:TMEM165/GDT1 family protein [Aetokthonos hydrillicola]MBO3458060.1 TMEM165/GDT1 family protein [Aetokthonos hydrillicola CCALA 1050]MBW4587105.1 TMEM165/GDT1 family protein [Aetokthonos hydrillicola CCALA 1050]MDR9899645.1 TMEM165/GDT1 family protein [Aetokthonos hydrillicola Thurmond2011]